MSKADKMLYNEGFETFNYIRFINSYHKDLLIYIKFDTKMHTVELSGADLDKFTINLFLQAAINKKCEELGWI